MARSISFPAGATYIRVQLGTTAEGRRLIAGSPSVVTITSYGSTWYNSELFYVASVTPVIT